MQYSVHLRECVRLNYYIFLFIIALIFIKRVQHFVTYSESPILLISQHGSDCTLLWQYCGIIINTDNC